MSATDPETPSDPVAHEAGATKSFWAHLNDLRIAVVRSAIAVGITLVLCLLLVNKLMVVLEYPLHRLDLLEKPKATVAFKVGEQRFGPYIVSRDQFAGLPPDENGIPPHAVYQVGAATIGGEPVATLKLLPPPQPSAVESSLQVRLLNLSPQEGFLVAFRVALYGALILSSPFWIWNLLGFILPALNRREREAIFPWLAWGAVLFMTGVAATYFFLLPLALRAAVMYSEWFGFVGTEWRAEEYIGFTCKFLLGMGIGFQFPLVVLFLVKIGVLTHHDLAKYRRHAIIVSFILGMVLTTPEVITQVAMAVPLCLLYETCIWIAWYWDWKKRRAARARQG